MSARGTLALRSNVLGSTSFTPSRIQPTVAETTTPGSATSNSLGSLVRIGTCVTNDDFEGFAEIELLNFPGKDAHDTTITEAGTLHRMSSVAHPVRSALLQSGFSPRWWPDFQTTASRRQNMALDRTSVFLKASVDDEKTGKEKVVAIAWLTAPAAYKASQRTWLHLFKNELLHPVVDGVSSRIFDQCDGTDWGMIDVYKKEVGRMRGSLMDDKPYFALCVIPLSLMPFAYEYNLIAREMFAVHPSCQGRGVGKRLLQHCIELAASEKIPFILESTAVGYSFYLASGFKVVERSHIEYCGSRYEWPVMVWKLSTLG